MKNQNVLLVITMVLLLTISVSGQIITFDYMRVKPENVQAYLELEKTWKKVHQERIKVGLIKGWYLYRVRLAGTDSPYQFVVATVYDQFDNGENLYFEGSFQKAWAPISPDSVFKSTYKLRDLTHTELFAYVDGTAVNYSNPAKWLYVNFINVTPGEENNYVDIERFVWKPMHQELQKSKQMASWSLWNIWFYTHTGYKYITLNAFYEYEDIDSYNYSETFEKVHQGKDLSQMLRNTAETRESVKTELWELIDYASMEKKF